MAAGHEGIAGLIAAMPSLDTTNEQVLSAAINFAQFQDRCLYRWLNAAIAVSNEAPNTTNHAQRAAFAGALFNNAISPKLLAMLVLANATNAANCIADPAIPGGNILDSDIDFQINSIFGGIATSRGW